MNRAGRFEWNLIALVALLMCGADSPSQQKNEPGLAAPMAAAAAAEGFGVPAGFHVNVFAAEPDVQNPIAMAWDGRGRLWIAENFTYSDSTQRFDLARKDRVVIFEDADGDGRFDRRTVFTDQVQMLASVELGDGGVWLMCPPQLLFLPDRNGDDVPDEAAEVVLDGFNVPQENYHTFANGLRWGPDGWLYGRCGASSTGEIGTPGTPPKLRVPLRGGMWRYHSRLKHFEVLAHGTTNPWGHDWNALGELFFINTVNGHLWHVLPGAHFVRPHTIDPNPRAYLQIDQHADHWHWDHGKPLVLGTAHPSDVSLGGGHAHSGAAIYLADQWPARYRGRLITLNFHGRRANVDRLERSGSGYVGRHEPDILVAADPWFRGLDLSYGPDGSLFVIDWSDTGDCHERDGVHRGSGRIFRVSYGDARPTTAGDVSRLDEPALVALHRHPNEWFVRQARRALAVRAARGETLLESKRALRTLFDQEPDVPLKLRALWSLYVIDGADEIWLRVLLDHPDEAVRAWAIRLLTDHWPIDTVFSQRIGADVEPPSELLAKLIALAGVDPSALVRAVLASTLQRSPVNRRAALARPLLSHAEDATDHNLPALLWTGLIPLADQDPQALISLVPGCRIEAVAGQVARRLAEDIDSKPAPVSALLRAAAGESPALQSEVIAGLSTALAGLRKARKPDEWDAFKATIALTAQSKTLEQVRGLDVVFGDGRALAEVRRLALDDHAGIEVRASALKTLIENRPSDLRSICERLLRVRYLNVVALRGLALFDDPALGRALARNYHAFHPAERAAALETLVSRPEFARALLDQVAAGRIPRADITPFHARQIASSADLALASRLTQVWGELRVSANDRRERMSALKSRLGPTILARADLPRGRTTFDRVCGSCHKLYGDGGDIGPDLTGSGRNNLDYLLENIVDPSAVVTADFRMAVVALRDGRVLNGIVKRQTEKSLTLQTQTEAIVIERSEIESLRPSSSSLMPDGLLDNLSADEIRDLIAYLAHQTQVPLGATGAGARSLGKSR